MCMWRVPVYSHVCTGACICGCLSCQDPHPPWPLHSSGAHRLPWKEETAEAWLRRAATCWSLWELQAGGPWGPDTWSPGSDAPARILLSGTKKAAGNPTGGTTALLQSGCCLSLLPHVPCMLGLDGGRSCFNSPSAV